MARRHLSSISLVRAAAAIMLTGGALTLALAGVSAQQTGVRDSLAQPTIGTATISGQVVLDDATPQPVRRARVTVASLQGGATKWTMTDASGQFVIADLPAGRYTITAAKPGIVRATYGAKRFDRPGTPVSVADGQHAANLVLKMLRGAVLTGVIRDENGQPAPGVRVQAQQFRVQNGERMLMAVAGGSGELTDTTDDRGMYRIFGLGPGEYVLSAMPRDTARGDIQQTTDADLRAAQQAIQGGGGMTRPPQLSAATNNANAAATPAPRVIDGPTIGFATVFYPGTPSPAEAQTLNLAAGEERSGVDLQLRLLHTARVEGIVTTPAGVPPQSVSLLMSPGIQGQPQVRQATVMMNGVTPGPDGKFVFTGVAPGQYTINARASSQPMGAGANGMGDGTMSGRANGPGRAGGGPINLNLWATAEIAVDGQNVSGVALSLQPGMTVSGHLAFEGTRTAPAGDLSRAMLILVPSNPGGGARVVMFGGGAGGPNNGPVDSTGKFSLTGITPGRYTVIAQFNSPEAAWTLKSAIFKGRDALDFPLEIAPNEEITNAVVTFTDQTQTISGKLSDASGRPAPDFTIVVFPSDKSLWTSSRRIKTTRPGTDGKYTITDLPAGDYRIAALIDIAQGEANDPAFLEQLVGSSISLSLKDGETKTQDLKIASGAGSGH